MAKKKHKYPKGASEEVKGELRRYKKGIEKSGKAENAGKVKSRKNYSPVHLIRPQQGQSQLSAP